jgi:hypothetical protein
MGVVISFEARVSEAERGVSERVEAVVIMLILMINAVATSEFAESTLPAKLILGQCTDTAEPNLAAVELLRMACRVAAKWGRGSF